MLHRLGGAGHAADRAGGGGAHFVDGGGDVHRGGGGALGQLAHLVGHHGKAPAGFAGAGGLDGGVQRQEIGLVGDVGNGARHVANLADGLIQPLDGVVGVFDGAHHGLGGAHAGLDVGIAGLHLLARGVGGVGGLPGAVGHFLHRLAEFFGGGGHAGGAGLLRVRLRADLGHVLGQLGAARVDGL